MERNRVGWGGDGRWRQSLSVHSNKRGPWVWGLEAGEGTVREMELPWGGAKDRNKEPGHREPRKGWKLSRSEEL